MKTGKFYLFALVLFVLTGRLLGQTATLTENIGDEGDIRNGAVYQVVVTVTNDTFVSGVAQNTQVNSDFLDALKTGDAAWDGVVDQMDHTDFTLAQDDTVLTIEVDPYPDYYINADDQIGLTIPSNALKSGSSLVVSNNIQISNLLPSAAFSGTFTGNPDESAIRNGDQTFVITLDHNRWHPDIGSSAPLLNAVKAIFTGPSSFDDLLDHLESGDLALNGDRTTLTVTFRGRYNFFIDSDITVQVDVNTSPQLLEVQETIQSATTDFTIGNVDPVISVASLSHTESVVRITGFQFDITLEGDVWENPLSSNFDDRITGDTAWNNHVQPSNVSVSRTNDSVVTVTVGSTPGYDIAVNDTVTITVDGGDLQFTGSGIYPVSGRIVITPAAASVSAGGTITGGLTEGDIRNQAYDITLGLSEDAWVTDLMSDPVKRRTLVENITASPAESGWDDLISDILGSDDGLSNMSRNGDVITIAVPAVPDFNITQDISLSAVVPPELLQYSGSSLSDNGFATLAALPSTLTIASSPSSLAEDNLDGAVLTATLEEETYDDGTFDVSNFFFSPSIPGLSIDAGTFQYVSADVITFSLLYSGDMDTDQTFGLRIDAAELTTGPTLTSSNTLAVTAQVEPVITGVDIPDQPMGIGTVVEAEITVENDQGFTFSYHDGTIAGRLMDSVVRDDATTYLGYFTVQEGSSPQYTAAEPIPVTDLVLQNGTIPGVAFTGSVSNPGDPLDSERPVVDLVEFDGGTYIIGDMVEAIVHAGETGLDFDMAGSHINHVGFSGTNVSVSEIGSGIYRVRYTVEAGNDDVTGIIPVSVVMTDGAGNHSAPNTMASGTSPVIDANRPEISGVEVLTSGIQVPGNTIPIRITATETGLDTVSGTKVNGVSDPVRIGFTDNGDQTYRIEYLVGAGDNEVAAGNLTVRFILEDGSGNTRTHTTLPVNDISIVTSGATAYLFGGGAICRGDSSLIQVDINGGTPPYDVVISDGINDSTFLDMPGAFSLWVKPNSSRDYSIQTVTDDLGIAGDYSGSAHVEVHPLPVPQIMNVRTTYLISEEGINLKALPQDGVFTGPGVETSTSRFFPEVAGVDGSPHPIVYTYEDEHGCTGTDLTQFTVVSEVATLTVPDTICFNAPPVAVEGNNSTGGPGTFDLYQVKGNTNVVVTDGLVDSTLTDDRAHLLPEELERGIYRVVYHFKFQDSIPRTIDELFYLDEIPSIRFTQRPGDAVCRNEDASSLETNLDENEGTYQFTGSGVEFIPGSGYSYNPGLADVGANRIRYQFVAPSGCMRRDSIEVINQDVPAVDFTPTGICIPESGGPVGFINTTDKEDLVAEWRWEYGDVNSGSANTDTFALKTNPVHDYTGPGLRTVSLEIITRDGCIASRDSSIDFADKPIADFRWVSDCYVEGAGVDLVNKSASERTWDSFKWLFARAGNPVFDSTITQDQQDIAYTFPDMANYDISLIAVNDKMCTDTLQSTLVLKPNITLKDTSFLESFDGIDVKWDSRSDTATQNSWVRGEPDFSGFVPESGDYAFYTDFPEDPDQRGVEQSWVQSPCFDFRGMERPMIRMDIMRSFDFNRDGAVLQYTLNNGLDWVTVGNIGEGISWYNSFDIKEEPGGSSIGWSGEALFDPDTTWVQAAHDLDMLRDEETVIFRIIYGTDGASVVDNEGFAFDDIYLGERSKRALIEHFTNSSADAAPEADDAIDEFTDNNSLDVVNLQYHMHFPGADPMNENNPSPAASRSFYYGVNQVPFALMDGGFDNSYRYDFAPGEPDASSLKQLTLESPLFDIDLRFWLYDTRMRIRSQVTAMEEVDEKNLVQYIVVAENRVSSYEGENGDAEFKNVVLGMLPSPAGTLYEKAWTRDESMEISHTWPYAHVEDLSDLVVVSFIQERETGKVLQVSAALEPEFPLGAGYPFAREGISIYPNPVGEQMHVDLDRNVPSSRLVITDLTGRILMKQEVIQGEKQIIETVHLEQGSYLLLWKEGNRLLDRVPFIKVQ